MEALPTKNVILALLSTIGISTFEVINLDLLKYISIFILGFNIKKISSNKTKIKELKKYKMFIELIEELGEKELNSSKYIKAYEHENIYSKDLNINTLDSFNLKEIESIYKIYKMNRG